MTEEEYKKESGKYAKAEIIKQKIKSCNDTISSFTYILREDNYAKYKVQDFERSLGRLFYDFLHEDNPQLIENLIEIVEEFYQEKIKLLNKEFEEL